MRPLLMLLPLAAVGLVAARGENPKPARAPAKPTYAKDVAPIVNRACVSCHRSGEVAPFSLSGYDSAKKWSAMTAAVTKTKRMPPWKAEAGYGEFQHENRLTDVEIQTLANWAATGAPRGDKRIEPTPPAPVEGGWSLGKPDMILKSKGEYKLSADGEDVYRNFVIENPSDTEMWVKAADVHPGNKKVVHHVIVFTDAMHQGRKLAAKADDGQDGYKSEGGGVGFAPTGALCGWAPGSRPQVAPTGIAMRVPPKADLVMQVHYHKSGKPEIDATSVGLYFAKEPIEKELRLFWLLDPSLNIPAGEKAFRVSRTMTIPANATLYGAMPHMHLLGRTMRAKAVAPDGKEIPLIGVPDWDFNWQLMYAFKEPIKAPAGTKLVVEATYDNSVENPNNPNSPPKRVHWGEQTTDEMFLMVIGYTLDAEVRGKGVRD